MKWGKDLENRAAHPHQEFSGVPPSPETNLYVVLHVNGENKIHWTGGNDFRYYNWPCWNPYVCVYSGYVHTIPDCFSFRHKKQSGKAMAQNWNKLARANVSGVNLTFPHSPPSQLFTWREETITLLQTSISLQNQWFLKGETLVEWDRSFKNKFFFLAKFSTSVAGVRSPLEWVSGERPLNRARP